MPGKGEQGGQQKLAALRGSFTISRENLAFLFFNIFPSYALVETAILQQSVGNMATPSSILLPMLNKQNNDFKYSIMDPQAVVKSYCALLKTSFADNSAHASCNDIACGGAPLFRTFNENYGVLKTVELVIGYLAL